ncbi:MAG: transcriptional regulator [Bacteroidota bacterium]
MKSIIEKLNKIFDSHAKLGIMSILMVNEWVNFKTFKEMLQLTDGNLASHMSALEKHQFVEVRKQFVGRRPQTTYNATDIGRKAFKDHLDALEELLKNR